MPHLTPQQFFAFLVACAGAVTDVRTGIIPNLLTFPTALIGIIMNTMAHGWSGLADSIAGWVVGVAVTIIASIFSKMGMGDAKLMGAVGAFLGWVPVCLAIGYFCILWGIFAAYQFVTVVPWKNLIGKLAAVQAGGQLFTQEEAQRINKKMKASIPLAVFLAGGVLIAELFGDATLQFMGFGPT